MEEIRYLLEFLRDLGRNNCREWLHDNEARYRRAMECRDAVAASFIAAVACVEPGAAGMTPRDVTYRLMRDTRFSADKTPYKTHAGIFVNPPLGKKSLLSGYYLHLEPGASILCGGNYGLPSPHLAAVRRDIRDNIDEYVSIVEDPQFRRYFPTVGMELLKTAPKGFDRTWQYIDYVRPREFGVVAQLDDASITAPGAIEAMHPMLEQIHRYNRFINFALQESGLPLRRER